MNQDDKFFDLKFHEIDVLLLLKDINPSKAAGPDGIHGTVLKNCAAALAKPLRERSQMTSSMSHKDFRT